MFGEAPLQCAVTVRCTVARSTSRAGGSNSRKHGRLRVAPARIGPSLAELLTALTRHFNVAVVPEHRRTGLGAELTAAVVADGAAVGGTWAYLQSSDDGLPVYERLGFRTVDTWWSWMPQGSDDH